MEILVVILSSALGLFVFLYSSLSKWNGFRYERKGLPPGTMGWPFFGETLEFLKQGPDFMKKQRARYGSVFKSHILGSPTIISMDPELNRYILLNEVKGLVPGYPQSMSDILGPNISTVFGSAHKHIRNNILSLIGTPVVKDRLLPALNRYMKIHLSNWDGTVIDLQAKTMEMVFFVVLNQIISKEESDSIYELFRSQFDKLLVGSISLPIYLPGTNYFQGYKGRKTANKILTDLMENRRASSKIYDDMLEHLLRDADSKKILSDEEIISQIITILYSGYETVSTTSMMALKYLHDHPEALQKLRDENLAIRKGKSAEQSLQWEDYKDMSFTRAVVFETFRLATITNGVLRKTTKEMTLNGHVIPKGWKIYAYTRELNYDPLLYPEPLKFNPWRWMENKNLESHNYCLFFGAGNRLCPGKELGIVKISTFLHYFVTKYRWEEIGGDKIHKFPRVEAPNGYHIKVMDL